MVDVQWHINGDYLLGCNCDFGCPCNFNARPTNGFCQGMIGFLVEEGGYGDVSLDGTKAFLACKWPGAIHEGNGVASIYIDDGATEEQRDALVKITSGEAGGPPFEIFAATFSHIAGVHFVAIDVTVAGEGSEVSVDGRARMSFQEIRNPVTGAAAHPKVVLPEGFIFKEGDQYALKEFWVNDGPELNFAHPGKCAELAKVRWSNA